MTENTTIGWLPMGFPERLVAARRNLNLTQSSLAEAIRVSATQIKRYEAGKSEPTLDVIRRLAVALHTSADALVFDKDERQPPNDLTLEFEAIANFSDEEKRIIKSVLKGLILKHEAERWADKKTAS